MPVSVVKRMVRSQAAASAAGRGVQGARTKYSMTAHDRARESPTPTSPEITPRVTYSTPRMAETVLRLAPRILRIAPSRRRRNLVDATDPDRMNRPARMLKRDMKSTRVFSFSVTFSTVRMMSRVLRAVTLGRASTTACCRSSSLGSGTCTVATNVCGAPCKAPGEKIMKKFVRMLRQSTWRMLVTGTVTLTPWTSMVSCDPMSAPRRRAASSSRDTWGTDASSGPHHSPWRISLSGGGAPPR